MRLDSLWPTECESWEVYICPVVLYAFTPNFDYVEESDCGVTHLWEFLSG